MGLTPKQEKFVQNIVKGMSQRQAYKKAYNAKYSEKAIDEKACVLFNSEKVQKRYNELMGKLEQEAIMTAQERMKWLSDVIKGNIKEKTAVLEKDEEGNSVLIEKDLPSKLDTKLKALDTLNKMSGEYVTKVEGEVKVSKLEDLL